MLQAGRAQAAKQVNTLLLQTYWHIGRYIVEFERKGEDRANYGDQLSTSFIQTVKQIIAKAQSNAVRAVNQERGLMYWHIGRHIVEEELQGKERADDGTYLIKTLAKELEQDFGSGFSVRQLETCSQFYNTFPICRLSYWSWAMAFPL